MTSFRVADPDTVAKVRRALTELELLSDEDLVAEIRDRMAKYDAIVVKAHAEANAALNVVIEAIKLLPGRRMHFDPRHPLLHGLQTESPAVFGQFEFFKTIKL